MPFRSLQLLNQILTVTFSFQESLSKSGGRRRSAKLPELSKDFSFKAVDLFKMDTDCGSQICHTEFKLVQTCHLYVETPNTNCSIPCNVSPCRVEIFHNIRCPIISCTSKSTTTTMVPFITTVSPTPSPSQCSGPLCISSLTVNGFLAILILLGGIFGYRKIKIREQRRNYINLDDSPNNPIIRGFENVNLTEASETNPTDPASVRSEASQGHQHRFSFLAIRSFFSRRANHEQNQNNPV